MARREPTQQLKRYLLIGTVAAVALLGVAYLALGDARSGPDPATRRLMFEIGADLIDQELSERQRLWRLERDRTSGTARLGDLPEDTLIFLNFWATWCQPCVDEMPSMLKLADRMRGRRFAMVAVSYDDSWEAIDSFFDQLGGGTPAKDLLGVLRDPTRRGEPLRQTFGTFKLPETYIIYNGRVLSRFVNLRDWTDPSIVRYLEQLAPPR